MSYTNKQNIQLWLVAQKILISFSLIFFIIIFKFNKDHSELTTPMRQNFMKDLNNIQQTSSKISRSKSRNHVNIIKLKQKEQGWNDRFHLQQIPQYNYQNQPYLQNIKNKLRIPKNNQKIDFGVGKPRKNKQFKQASLQKNKITNKPNPRRLEEKYKQSIRKAFSDLKQLWIQKNIPESHMQAMTKILSKQNNPMKILEQIKVQFSEISKQVSFIQKAMNSVQTREACILKVKQLCQKVKKQENLNGFKNEFEEIIQHLRVLTIHTVECIFHWRQYVQSLYERQIRLKYMHNSINYFIKIKKDYSQISSSRFSQIYQFPEKIDPFFLNITTGNKKITSLSKNFMKRIKLCQSLLQQQSMSSVNLIKQVNSPKIGKSLPPNNISGLQKVSLTKINVEYSQFSQYFNNLKSKSPLYNSLSSNIDHFKYQQYTIYSYQNENQIIIAIDKNSSQRKIIILAVNCKITEFQRFIQQVCTYLWQHDQCSQIRIGLMHISNQNGVYSVDTQLQKKLKSLGFRWICVNNNDNIRITIYALKRPLNRRCINNYQFYPVIIQHFTGLEMNNNNNKRVASCVYLSILQILKLIEEKKQKQVLELIESNQQFVPYLEKLKNIQNYSYSGLKSIYINNQEELDKIINNLSIKPQSKFPNYLSFLNISFKFKNNYFIDQKYIKFFPTKEIQIIICQSIYPIYLLQTDQQNINIFIFQVQSTFTTNQIQNVFNAMGQQVSFIDQFWIPMFRKSTNYTDQVGFSNQMLVSTDYKTKLQSLTRKWKTKTKIIKAPFVFGLINKQLLQILQVPFFCTLINKEDII